MIINLMRDQKPLKEMVERVPWMSPVHYEILGFFDSHDIWISARGLAKNIDYNRNYVSKECGTLVERDVLQKDGRIYCLTETGREFLAGNISADELEHD